MAIQANRNVYTVGKSNTAFVGVPVSVPASSITIIVNVDADASNESITVEHVRNMMNHANKNILGLESAGTVYVAGNPALGKDNIRTESVFANILATENAIGFSGNIRTNGHNFLLNLLQQTLDTMREQTRLFN